MEKTTVLIIGAGAAGLMAARTLRKAGTDFIVVEASDRPGGRAMTREGSPHIEYGPEFLHGETPVTDSLLEEFRIPWYDMEFDYHLFQEGKLRPLADFWERLSSVLGEINLRGKDLSFSEYLEKFDHHSDADKKIARAFVQGFDAADLTSISTRALSEMRDQVCDPDARRMRRPLSGYGPLMKALSLGLNRSVRFHHRVQEIEWREGSVTVKGVAGEGQVPFLFQSEKVIVTASLGALRNIRLTPSPHELTDFLGQNEMGQVVKLIAEMDPAFFHQFSGKCFPFVVAPDLLYTAWWTTTPIHSMTLTAWAGGEKARKLYAKTREERELHLTQELAMICGQCPTRIQAWIRAIHHYDWGKDPLIQGAYSYPQMIREERLWNPRTDYQNTLFLAGEAFHPDFSGTIEGAFQTGQKAAEKINALSGRKTKQTRYENFGPRLAS